MSRCSCTSLKVEEEEEEEEEGRHTLHEDVRKGVNAVENDKT